MRGIRISSSGADLTKDVTQVAHGFSVGSVVRLDGSTYVAAQADAEANANAVSIVIAVADVDNFTIQSESYTSVALGLSNGDEAWLSTTVAGGIQTSEPTEGEINVFLGQQTPQGFLINIQQGFLVTSGSSGKAPTTGTGTVLDLSNYNGTYYNMDSADTNTTYTFSGEVLGGVAIKLINTSTEPTVIGAFKINKGVDFIEDTNIYLTVHYNGNRVDYWFEDASTLEDMLLSLPFGMIIDKSTTANLFLGTPSILTTSTGRVLASCVEFGSASTESTSGVTRVFYSDNINSNEFIKSADVSDMFWGTLFEFNGDIYLLGISKVYGNVTISKSTDDGETWSAAVTVLTAPTGAFVYTGWHKTSNNIIFKDGYLVCPIEAVRAVGNWADIFHACLVFADLTDLTNPSNWSYSNIVEFNGTTLESELISEDVTYTKQPANEPADKGFLEGSLIELTSGDLRLFKRVEQAPNSNHSLYMNVAWDAVTPTASVLGSTQNYVDLLGGNVSFQIVYDGISGKHWCLANGNRYRYFTDQRTELFLSSSDDEGLTWQSHGKVLGFDVTISDWESVINQNAVSYPSFEIVGNDLLVALRTSDDDAADYHDTNILSLAKIENFRDKPVETFVDGAMIIDENSNRLEDINGIALIEDQSVNYNSPFMLSTDNAFKPNWVTDGIQFDGASYLRLLHNEKLCWNHETGMSVFIVIENLQDTSSGLRILSNDNGVDPQNTDGTGGWWITAQDVGLENRFAGYTDLTLNNDYILATSFDNSNNHLYNYINGVNRGNPPTKNNVTWDTDHLVLPGAYTGPNFKEILIGRRDVGSALYFTSKIKAIHIIPSYLTPIEIAALFTTLNTRYNIY